MASRATRPNEDPLALGMKARAAAGSRDDNPFSPGSSDYLRWSEGFALADETGMKVPKGAIARPQGGEDDDAPISAEEAREFVRYMLKVGYAWRMRAETMFVMKPTADKRNE